jgi:hypothetical protein
MRTLLLIVALCCPCLVAQVNLNSTIPAPQVRGLLQPVNGGTGISTVGVTGCPQVNSGVWSISNANCLSFGNQAANLFFTGPCSGSSATPAFRFLCSVDFAAALTSDPNFTISSANINNTGQIVTSSIFVSGVLGFATQCVAGDQAFALGFISNGVFTGPIIAPVTTTGVCPTQSSFSTGNWAVSTLSIQNGGGLLASNCGSNSSCPSSSPGLSQNTQYVPTAPTGACPGTPFPGPTNQPTWSFSATGSIDFCSNQTGATWVNKVP